jgi:uncharacterized protein (DUF488 family)
VTVMTIGYEGLKVDELIALLLAHGVETLIDVRATPLSRKPGFSKNALSRFLAQHGIEYVHFSALGCPKPIRDAYRRDGDWTNYTQHFLAYLDTQADVLNQLGRHILASQCCLLCFEADPDFCHRSYVAVRMAQDLRGTKVVHLRSQIPILSDFSMAPMALEGIQAR